MNRATPSQGGFPGVSARSRIRQHPERALAESSQLAQILARAVVGHIGVALDGLPVVVPMLIHHEGELLYVHGSSKSRLLTHLATGVPVCVSVAEVHALVVSRTALNHSANYASVVIFGRGAAVTGASAKRALLEALTARLLSGRAAGLDYLPATPAQLRATSVVAIQIEDWSGKSRTGGPTGPLDGDSQKADLWKGLAPLVDGGLPGHGPWSRTGIAEIPRTPA